jgi:hypothetical protein
MNDTNGLVVRVGGADLGAEQLAEMARNLRNELLVLSVDDVLPISAGPAPDGAKAIEAIALGALIVSMSPKLVGAVVDVVASWLGRQPTDVEVEIDGQRFRGTVTRQQREELVVAYLRRVGLDPGPQ